MGPPQPHGRARRPGAGGQGRPQGRRGGGHEARLPGAVHCLRPLLGPGWSMRLPLRSRHWLEAARCGRGAAAGLGEPRPIVGAPCRRGSTAAAPGLVTPLDRPPPPASFGLPALPRCTLALGACWSARRPYAGQPCARRPPVCLVGRRLRHRRSTHARTHACECAHAGPLPCCAALPAGGRLHHDGGSWQGLPLSLQGAAGKRAARGSCARPAVPLRSLTGARPAGGGTLLRVAAGVGDLAFNLILLLFFSADLRVPPEGTCGAEGGPPTPLLPAGALPGRPCAPRCRCPAALPPQPRAVAAAQASRRPAAAPLLLLGSRPPTRTAAHFLLLTFCFSAVRQVPAAGGL